MEVETEWEGMGGGDGHLLVAGGSAIGRSPLTP